MLPKSRILSALLVGLGLALVAAALAAPAFLNGDARFPLDLEKTTWTLKDPQAKVGEDTTAVTRQLHMTVQNPATDKVVALRIGDTLRREDKGDDLENLISAATWSLEMDRKTGEFVKPAKLSTVMVMPEEVFPAEGVWLKFPSNVQQQDYEVFEPTLRKAVPAAFTGEDEIGGRTVYTFEQKVEPVNVATLYTDMTNTITAPPEQGGEQAFLHHEATRTFAVDQVTGVVVGMTEKVDDYYADRDGNRVQEVVSYDAAMDEAQQIGLAEQLTDVTQDVSRTVTWVVIGLGGVLVLLGLAGAFRPGGGGARGGRQKPDRKLDA
ncbi:DUF3068 domain-containing protein [Corynebacterium meitnerae]|uniref:DUF3068 domain-containing protein n=1 Tax=Corynebacterium meitnerae TaxID=2913498 RepID=A0A9X3LY48_9CORY|nr:DUF3068 domain-containing protein [Corynebacterium meitnerae]MCZ9294883.1 DUF3068 domain-containing protein [Corynebacterium meitnerae]